MSRVSSLFAAYTFFREHMGLYATPPGQVSCALSHAINERAAQLRGLTCTFVDDNLPWDADCPAPRYVLVAFVRRVTDLGMSPTLASLGAIGVDSLDDPYLRVVAAGLYGEALAILDAEDQEAADALAARATYAGVAS